MEPLVERAVRGMLDALDPHSAYLTAEEMRSAEAQFDGGFGGVGIEYDMLHDTLVVVNVVSGGPAMRAGMRAGDRIVGIDGVSSVGMPRGEVPKRLRGAAGTCGEVAVVRRGEAVPRIFGMLRDRIPLETVDAAAAQFVQRKGVGRFERRRRGHARTQRHIAREHGVEALDAAAAPGDLAAHAEDIARPRLRGFVLFVKAERSFFTEVH